MWKPRVRVAPLGPKSPPEVMLLRAFFVLCDATNEMPHSVFPHVLFSLVLIYNTNTDFI